jgi:3-deoxy-D-manno-octulosonic-acid transferase
VRAVKALLYAAGAVALPLAAVALALRRTTRDGLAERLGRVPRTPPGVRAVWLHGASIGEVTALAPIARALRAELPDDRLVVSTLTLGGRAAATARIPEAAAHFLFPIDVALATAHAVDAVAPRLVLFTETELWPTFLATLAARGVPAMMVSGRVSEAAFIRYRRFRWLFAPALASVRWFCVQDRDTARRLVALGAPATRIVVTGSLKAAGIAAGATGGLTLGSLGVADRPVLVAASTHAGEEEDVLDAWPHVLAVAPDARLLLAPRRPERFAEVAAILERRGVAFARRSELTAGAAARWPERVAVLLLDTLGELGGLYAGARAAFVGGTLVPRGGHNVLEPAAAAVPVLFGPSTDTTRAAAERLLAAGGAVRVADAPALGTALVDLFADGGAAHAMGARARAVVDEGAGALTVTLAMVRATLGLPAAPGER